VEIIDLQHKGIDSANKIMEDRFNIVPIIAVVVAKEDDENQVKGILMPFIGPSMGSIYNEEMSATPLSGSTDLGPITRRQLQDLARGVNELAKIGVRHGDINEWNILLKPTAKGCIEESRLVLVDVGEVAWCYQFDAHALGKIFEWCAEWCDWDEEDQEKVREAARILKKGVDVEKALDALE